MKHLHLSAVHRSLGAELIPFAGWEMPLKYSNIVEEHLTVRNNAGLFDVSHMGEIFVSGKNALDFLQNVTSNDVSLLKPLEIQYSMVLNEHGGIKDDIMVYRMDEQTFMVVCNAINSEKIYNWLKQHAGEAEIQDATLTTVMLALQGPKAQHILQSLTDFELSKLKRLKAAFMEVAKVDVFVSRSGYTGEDGFELFIMNEPVPKPLRAEKLWHAILQAGSGTIKPCGLGARDTTRVEAGLVLYGQELTEEITPLEANLGYAVKLEKGNFMGRDALLKQKITGLTKIRIGLRMLEQGIPRQGNILEKNGETVGVVTSGIFSPLLQVGIAMGYADTGLALNEKINVLIRDKTRKAEVVSWPFYDIRRYGYKRQYGA